MCDANVKSNGDILYHDVKGYEDNFRKHHRSPVTRDIWLYSKGNYTKLTNFDGEDPYTCMGEIILTNITIELRKMVRSMFTNATLMVVAKNN